MQELYGRHFLAPFGSFDAIPDQDQPAIDPHRAWKQPQHGPRPQGRKPIKLDAAAVKVIEHIKHGVYSTLGLLPTDAAFIATCAGQSGSMQQFIEDCRPPARSR